MAKLKIGGTAYDWLQLGAIVVGAYLVWRLYEGTAGAIKAAAAKVRKVIDNDIGTMNVKSLAGYEAARVRIYDPALDPRGWFEKRTTLPPASAFREVTPQEAEAVAARVAKDASFELPVG